MQSGSLDVDKPQEVKDAPQDLDDVNFTVDLDHIAEGLLQRDNDCNAKSTLYS